MRPTGLGDDHTVLNESGPPKTGWCVPARTEPKLPSDIVVVVSSCLSMKIAITFRRSQKQPDVWNFTGELCQKAEQVRTDFVWNGDYPGRSCIVLKVSGSIERRRTVPVTSPGSPQTRDFHCSACLSSHRCTIDSVTDTVVGETSAQLHLQHLIVTTAEKNAAPAFAKHL